MNEWEETKSVVARRGAAVLAALEALYVVSLLAGLATGTDSETGESLAPVAATLLVFVIPLVIAFGATAWMLWRGRVWPAGPVVAGEPVIWWPSASSCWSTAPWRCRPWRA